MSDRRRLSLPGHAVHALMASGDDAELFAVEGVDNVMAWLDARGLDYVLIDDQETDEERLRRLFGTP
jgi:hypothetical protein